MTAQILIHWHPQFSFFHRAFIDAAYELNTQPENVIADVIVGANFLAHLDKNSVQFLEFLQQCNYKRLQIRKIIYVPDALRGNLVKSSLVGQKKFKYQFSERALRIFNNAVDDNLARSLFSDFDPLRYRIDPTYQQECFQIHRDYSCDLLDFYESIIDANNYSLVVISHGNYVYYVNLYIAAFFKGVETLVIHGGHGHSYIARSNQINDLCPSNIYDQLCSLCSPDLWDELLLPTEISADALQQPLSFVKGTTGGSLASYFKHNLDKYKWNGSQRVIMGLVPILMEFQHRNCLNFMNAFSKSDWIEKLVKFGSRFKEEIIFYLHPDIADGAAEKQLQVSLIKYFSSKYSHPCRIISDRDSAKAILADRPVIASSPSGTIASELAALGSTSIISNYCTPARMPGGTLVLDDHTTNADITESLFFRNSSINSIDNSITHDQLLNVIRLYKAIGKYNSKTLLLHTAMDKIYFFGRQTSKISTLSALSKIDDLYSNVNRGQIDTHSFSAIYSY